jgi:hypothetical protein
MCVRGFAMGIVRSFDIMHNMMLDKAPCAMAAP